MELFEPNTSTLRGAFLMSVRFISIFVKNRKVMKKLLFIAFVFITAVTHAQKVGVYDKNITATDTLETENRWMVANDTIVHLLDVSYFEFSSDGVTFSKDYTVNDTWMRVSNYSKTSWDTIRIQPLLWEVVGDSLKPVGSELIAGDSIFGGNINTALYRLNGDSLTYLNLPTGGGSLGYVSVNNGDGTASWQPLPSGVGGAYGANVGTSGIGVYVDTVGSELQFKNIAEGFGIDVSEADSVITVAWDGSVRTVTAGVALSGGGALDNNVTINLYIPELLQTTSLQGNLDYAVVYDNSVAGHRKVLTQEFYPDLYVENVLEDDNVPLFNFKAGDGLSVIGGATGVVQYAANPIVLLTDGTSRVARVDTIDIIGGTGVNIAYSDNGKITISTTPSGLPTCEEGEFLAVVGGEWACVNPCDYICSDTIINIINNYNDTANIIQPSGDVVINFSRLDCEDSTQILATDLAKTTLNLTSIKIVTAPTVGELHYNGVAVIDGQELSVTSGSLDTALYYVSDASTGSAYSDLFTFQLLYSSNADYLGTANVDVSVDACVTESVCFGYLYNYYTFTDSRELTSNDDWIVPAQTDWNTLNSYVSFDYNSLKATGSVFWDTANGTDTTGLGLRGGGFRTTSFSSMGSSGDYANTNNARASYRDGGTFAFVSVSTALYTGVSVRLLYTGVGTPTSYTGNDGKVYDVVKIGTQYWLAENLEETEYRNGEKIPNVEDNTTWANLTTGALCLYNNDTNNACKTPLPSNELANVNYGFLYNWYVTDGTGSSSISSSDEWTVCTDSQLTDLVTYAGGSSVSGAKLKEVGYTHWVDSGDPLEEGTDDYGFSARGVGIRISGTGDFNYLGQIYGIWTSTSTGTNTAYYRQLCSYQTITSSNHLSSSKELGMGVRLVKDATGVADGETTTYTGNNGKVYVAIAINELYWLQTDLVETQFRDGSWINGYNGGVYTPISNNDWILLDDTQTPSLCAFSDDESNAINE